MKHFILIVGFAIGALVAATPSYAAPVYTQDAIQFAGSNSGVGGVGLGQLCAASEFNACVQATGAMQDVTSIIDTMIPDGICCGTSSISVQITSSMASVVVADDYYGGFTGSFDESAAGSAAVLNWFSAVYGMPFEIGFTNAAGVITNALYNVGVPGFAGAACSGDAGFGRVSSLSRLKLLSVHRAS